VHGVEGPARAPVNQMDRDSLDLEIAIARQAQQVLAIPSLQDRNRPEHMPLRVGPPPVGESPDLDLLVAEDGWNSRDADKVSLAYSLDTQWRNRAEFTNGREEARQFLARKWNKELEYRLIKELWAYTDNRIAVRFQYEWRNSDGEWFRAHGNENWEFNEHGLMRRREASINDVPIKESERKFLWEQGIRPDDYPGLTELGL